MNAVIEIDEVRCVVDANPLQRPILAETRANGLQHGAVVPDLLMAIHADFRGGNSGERHLLYSDVTVSAVDAKACNVVLMTERNGLLANNILAGNIRRTNDSGPYARHDDDEENATKNRHT